MNSHVSICSLLPAVTFHNLCNTAFNPNGPHKDPIKNKAYVKKSGMTGGIKISRIYNEVILDEVLESNVLMMYI